MCCPLLCSHCGWLLLKCSAIGIGFNGAETNCRIEHILGILLMNSSNTDIFFSNYYHLQSVRFEMNISILRHTACSPYIYSKALFADGLGENITAFHRQVFHAIREI